jgi:15-cis-phytoene synthase
MAKQWNQEQWRQLETSLRRELMAASNEKAAWKRATRAARRVMARYSTSFFIVSRFLPPGKRERVEVIYASVRYPDEVVDTFDIPNEQKLQRLDEWSRDYERAVEMPDWRHAVSEGVTPFLAAFGKVVREAHIPPEHYRAFLSAMRMDVSPRPFQTLDDLIESYVYGSAIVVGYFLGYVYGSATPELMPDALACSRDLGIALQLTNFIRDVKEDCRRGRVYLPQDLLRAADADMDRLDDPAHRKRVIGVIRQVAACAEDAYRRSAENLEAFAPDSRIAIKACIDVYGRLNQRIMASDDCVGQRESVPAFEKFMALPARKYWHLPLCALGVR